MMTAFTELAATIGRTWRRMHADERVFHEIATDALRASRLLDTLDYTDVTRWLMQSAGVPPQDTYEFGQPPILVHAESGFYIQVLFWVDGTTSIHQHGFCGAFGVLHGSSVHSTYRFEQTHPVSPSLIAGDLTYLDSELLERGDVRPIIQEQPIHALFHLDRPSISVVIRTWGSERMTRQYDFLKPSLAIDPRYAPALQVIQLRMLSTLLLTDRQAFWDHAGDCVENGSPWMLYKVLALAIQKREEDERWTFLLERARRHHPDIADRIVACLDAEIAERRIVTLRSEIHDPTHRFFLALLLSVPNRDAIAALIAKKNPGADPDALMLRWAGEIFQQPRNGVKLTPLTVHLLGLAMQSPDFAHARPRLARYIRPGSEAQDERTLRETWDKLLAVDIFKPLFLRSPVPVG
jgi:hypothetical protein